MATTPEQTFTTFNLFSMTTPEKKEKYRPVGTLKFLNHFLDLMTTKKLVALFSDYEEAKQDIILELCANSDVEISEVENLVANFEEFTDMQEWWDDL